ncbi:unnamed protein product, partial [Adineta ricciae]
MSTTAQFNLLTTITTQSTVVTTSPVQTVPSYNRPKLDTHPMWSANAITFATSSTVGSSPYGIFITINNTIYVADRTNYRVQIWSNGSDIPSQSIYGTYMNSYSLFVTTNGDIFVDNGYYNGRVDKRTTITNTSVPVMYISSSCFGLFVDLTDTLYCSMSNYHQVIAKSLQSSSNIITTIAGTGCYGSTSYQLYYPMGIFVDTNSDLYVADQYNHRIQLFRSGQLTGITVAGSTSINLTIPLSYPSGIALDFDGYLFIVDKYNHRIVGSDSSGFRCVVGCTGRAGSSSNQLYYPTSMSFDNHGNMFVTDTSNSRIQKFIHLNNSRVPSYNQPKLCSDASWNPNATTFAAGGNNIIGSSPYGIFITINNTIYVADRTNYRVQIWSNGSDIPSQSIYGT